MVGGALVSEVFVFVSIHFRLPTMHQLSIYPNRANASPCIQYTSNTTNQITNLLYPSQSKLLPPSLNLNSLRPLPNPPPGS